MIYVKIKYFLSFFFFANLQYCFCLQEASKFCHHRRSNKLSHQDIDNALKVIIHLHWKYSVRSTVDLLNVFGTKEKRKSGELYLYCFLQLVG